MKGILGTLHINNQIYYLYPTTRVIVYEFMLFPSEFDKKTFSRNHLFSHINTLHTKVGVVNMEMNNFPIPRLILTFEESLFCYTPKERIYKTFYTKVLEFSFLLSRTKLEQGVTRLWKIQVIVTNTYIDYVTYLSNRD